MLLKESQRNKSANATISFSFLCPVTCATPVADVASWPRKQNSMHPPLSLSRNKHCTDVILALQACHSEQPLAKFFGACNQQKSELDLCFRAQVQSILFLIFYINFSVLTLSCDDRKKLSRKRTSSLQRRNKRAWPSAAARY